MSNKSFVVQYIIKARNKFSASADKVSRSVKKMGAQLDITRKKFKKFTDATKRAGLKMTAFVSAPFVAAVFFMKNAARDAEETESKFATVFSSISVKSNKAAKDLAKNYGLANTESKTLLANTGDLLTGFGFSQKKAFDLSLEVNKLAVDLASFTNFSGGASGASAALTKALLGERESVKSLGISILETDVKKKVSLLLSQGMQFASLRQAKAQATLMIALEQSKNAIGDFSRTQAQLANQERITSASTQNLKESFGKILLPVALKLTKAIRSIAIWLTNLSPSTKKTILVFGAFLAIIGPLLLALSALGAMFPFLIAGFGLLKIAVISAFGPIGLVIAGIVAGAALIITNWETVKGWFTSFWVFLVGIFDKLKEMVIGFINKFSGIKKALGFLGFGKTEIETREKRISEANINARSRVDVGVRVGLDKGLKQTSEPVVVNMGARRADVGMATP